MCWSSDQKSQFESPLWVDTWDFSKKVFFNYGTVFQVLVVVVVLFAIFLGNHKKQNEEKLKANIYEK
jgi:hypothetical protein